MRHRFHDGNKRSIKSRYVHIPICCNAIVDAAGLLETVQSVPDDRDSHQYPSESARHGDTLSPHVNSTQNGQGIRPGSKTSPSTRCRQARPFQAIRSVAIGSGVPTDLGSFFRSGSDARVLKAGTRCARICHAFLASFSRAVDDNTNPGSCRGRRVHVSERVCGHVLGMSWMRGVCRQLPGKPHQILCVQEQYKHVQ
eukprot:GHVR01097688.1.p1 GENE.GHVR01097688.1~~GHVR01097688.1.p1  ORF type:complete len:197 (-),score=0.19 GHVR01097688.1:346-936(-)